MQSDIVARMRSNARFFGLIEKGRSANIEPEFCRETAEWSTEAADEIERLRETVDGYRMDLFKKVAEVQQLRAELRTYTGDGHTLGEDLAREAL